MSRLVFRLLDEDGSHWYLDRDGHWDRSHDDAYVFATPSEARAELKAFRKLRPEEGKAVRVCRLYTADETRRRRQARLLRDLATRYVVRREETMTELHSRSFIPGDEPFLSEWCKLDTLHQTALKEDTSKSLLAACYLADAKYEVWLRWTKLAVAARLAEALREAER